ncbi:MAG TPA: hypothetical protein VIL28_03260 [Steroidobacteraceae bacterium]
MIVLPQIRAVERAESGVRVALEVPTDLAYFNGHFPGCPLLPGVVQISWAIQLGRAHVPFDGRFRALSAVKFTRVILPGASVALRLDYSSDTRTLDFAYEIDGRVCSSGTASFEPD